MPAQGRTSGSADTSQVIVDTATRLFHDRGFHGTSIRDIAREANVGIATLFHHHGSKGELLRRIVDGELDELLNGMREAVAAAGGHPADRLGAAVRSHVRRQCERPMESAIATTELRCLEPPLRDALIARHCDVHGLFSAPIADGVASGAFRCDAPRETARALHGMCTAVTSWYRPGEQLSAEEVGDLYVGMALRLVGAPQLAPAG